MKRFLQHINVRHKESKKLLFLLLNEKGGKQYQHIKQIITHISTVHSQILSLNSVNSYAQNSIKLRYSINKLFYVITSDNQESIISSKSKGWSFLKLP